MAGPRTPLRHPQEYFADASKTHLQDAALVVGVVSVVSAAGVAVILGEFASALDVTVQVQNPAHTPEWACDGPTVMNSTPEGCDPSVPEKIDRRLGALVAEEFSWAPLATLFAVPAMWLLQGAVLHLGTVLFDAEGSFGSTLAVAGWGMAPSMGRLLAVGALMVYQLRTASVGETPEGAVGAIEAAVAAVGPVSMLAAVVVAVWAGYVRVYGLAERRGVDPTASALLVGVLTLIGLLFELA